VQVFLAYFKNNYNLQSTETSTSTATATATQGSTG